MKSMHKHIALAALALGFAGTAAQADMVRYSVDGANSSVTFKASSILTTQTGHASQISGSASVNETSATFGLIGGAEIVVATSSMEMGNHLATVHMNKAVEPSTYPEIRFTVTSVQPNEAPASGGNLTLSGTWKMHGASQNVSVPVSVSFENGIQVAHVTGDFTLSLKDYNIAAPTFGPASVNDAVKVHLDLRFKAGQ